MDITAAQEAWLIKHYKHTKNAEVAAHLGISQSTMHRIVRKLGLKKTPQFMRKCQKATTEAAKESHLRNGTYPPKGYVIPNRPTFPKGVSNVERFGKRVEAERIRKSTESREKTRKSEKARATFGLPQRTKMHVIPVPRAKIYLRWYLKSRGYILDEIARVAYYDENTKRGKRIEGKPQRWYKFLPMAKQMEA